MPITQTRMIALLHATIDYQHAHADLKSTITRYRDDIRAGRTTLERAFADLCILAGDPLSGLRQPIQTSNTTTLESSHFTRSTQSRNIRVARAQHLKRQAQAQAEGRTIIPRPQTHGQFSIHTSPPPIPPVPSTQSEPEFDYTPPPDPPHVKDYQTLEAYVSAIKATSDPLTWTEYSNAFLSRWTKDYNDFHSHSHPQEESQS